MNQTELENLKVFASLAAIKKGHFVYSSGRHGTVFVDAESLFRDSKVISGLCQQIAQRFRNSSVNLVTGPANNGVVVASWVADHLSRLCSRRVALVPTFKTLDNGFSVRPTFRHKIFNQRVLVVEDVLTTGGSAQRVIEVVRALGGNVVGFGALYNRGGEISRGAVDVSDFFVLVNVPHQSWVEEDCPLCKNRVPVNPFFGKGREFSKRKQA